MGKKTRKLVSRTIKYSLMNYKHIEYELIIILNRLKGRKEPDLPDFSSYDWLNHHTESEFESKLKEAKKDEGQSHLYREYIDTLEDALKAVKIRQKLLKKEILIGDIIKKMKKYNYKMSEEILKKAKDINPSISLHLIKKINEISS